MNTGMNDPVIVSKIALNLEKEGESFGFLFYRAGQVYSHALQQHLSGKAAGSLTSLQIELLLQLCNHNRDVVFHSSQDSHFATPRF